MLAFAIIHLGFVLYNWLYICDFITENLRQASLILSMDAPVE